VQQKDAGLNVAVMQRNVADQKHSHC